MDLGNGVGLAWSRRTQSYDSSVSSPDGELHFVVLDGVTLQAKSNIVSIVRPGRDGALVAPQLARVGSDIVMVADVAYHVSAESMSATVRCN